MIAALAVIKWELCTQSPKSWSSPTGHMRKEQKDIDIKLLSYLASCGGSIQSFHLMVSQQERSLHHIWWWLSREGHSLAQRSMSTWASLGKFSFLDFTIWKYYRKETISAAWNSILIHGLLLLNYPCYWQVLFLLNLHEIFMSIFV